MRGLRGGEAGGAALAAGLSALFGLLVLRPWRGALDVPYSYAADGNLYQAYVKGVLDHGWYWRNPSLGAPGGQQLYDFPGLGGDTLNVLLLKLLGLFTDDAAVVTNLFFFLTFPLVGLTAYVVLRSLSVSSVSATVCSILYALLPYHFVRGEEHLLLSAYYAVPLGAYLVLAVLGERPLFARRVGGSGVLAWASRRSVVTLGMCVVLTLASATFYYSSFTVVLVALAAVLRAVAGRSWRPLVAGGAVVGVLVALTVVTLAPSLAYWARHGTNSAVGHRGAFESEFYGLKFAQLVLPMEHHRIGKLAEFRQRYDSWSPRTEATRNTALGVVASVGFLWLLAVALVQLATPGRRVVPALHGEAGIAALVALALAWTGGLATLIAVVEPQIRSWNRLSVFIGFFALLAVGLLLDRAVAALEARRAGKALAAAAVFAVLVVGLLDQTSSAFQPRYGALSAEYRSDGDFVRGIEGRVPAGGMVFQLPYVPFPEAAPPARMFDYDELRGYLHSGELRWSYGAMKGRPGDPSPALAAEPVPDMVRDVRAAGFGGIYVDRFGYEDGGARLESELASAVGSPPLVSKNGRLSFFDLAG
jgi:phosphoglycerol transferase